MFEWIEFSMQMKEVSSASPTYEHYRVVLLFTVVFFSFPPKKSQNNAYFSKIC